MAAVLLSTASALLRALTGLLHPRQQRRRALRRRERRRLRRLLLRADRRDAGVRAGCLGMVSALLGVINYMGLLRSLLSKRGRWIIWGASHPKSS